MSCDTRACGRTCSTCGGNPDAWPHHLQAFLGGGAPVEHNGMMCSGWGGPKWFTLHVEAKNYPLKPTADDKKRYRTYLEIQEFTLPCCCCCSNYRRHLNEMLTDKVFESRETFFRFIFDLHNVVNKDTGKPVRGSDKDFAKIDAFYESLRAGRGTTLGRAFVVVKSLEKHGGDPHSILIEPECAPACKPRPTME